ncbi:hypothetical protein BS47DRAFT_1262223, partial [Hydnum rufescens UP504]
SSRQRFLSLHPSWTQAQAIDHLRRREFTRLRNGTYLDYTGAGLYPESLIKSHSDLLRASIFGNPHSSSPSSVLSSRFAHEARSAILEFFDADPEQYSVVFTSNCSNALRLVGESYPYTSGSSRIVLPVDAHNSVNGLREFAIAAGADTVYIPMDQDVPSALASLPPLSAPGLFVLTGQSNLTGIKGDLCFLRTAKLEGYDTLLDAAALAPTSRISISSFESSVDAMTISLYKMVGFPTGLGALIAKKEFLMRLRKRWFSGGSVRIVQIPGEGRLLLDGHERWEDGTINFLSFPVIKPALRLLKSYMPVLSIRLSLLMHFTLSALRSLSHDDGTPLVLIHSPSTQYTPSKHGAIISLSVVSSTGKFVPPRIVERRASLENIHIRAGCMCNPGATSELLGLADRDGPAATLSTYAANEDMERLIEEEGVVRVSFGLASSLEDSWAFISF